MESENIRREPINPAGAIEMGVYPCHYCESGWGSYTSGESKTCHDDCEYIRQYSRKMFTKDVIGKGVIVKMAEGTSAGKDNIEGTQHYCQVVCPCCDGRGFQHNKQTGINEPCRCCNGSGIGLPGTGNIKTTTAEVEMKG